MALTADSIQQIIDAVAVQAAAAIDAVVPIGQAVTGSFAVLSILMLGLAIMNGGSAYIAPIVSVMAASTGTFYAVTYWQYLTLQTLQAARDVVALMLPGYQGPGTLFTMANDVFARVITEAAAVASWTPSSWTDAIASALCAILIWAGLSITGLLAFLAEFQLVIGAAAAPLILPALAFRYTASIGWSAVMFLVSAGVRCVVMGAVSFIMARVVTSLISVPGTDQSLDHQQVATLMAISLLTALAGICCNNLARDLVTGAPGAIGWGSVGETASLIGRGTDAAHQVVVGKAGQAGRVAGGAGGGGVAGGGASAGAGSKAGGRSSSGAGGVVGRQSSANGLFG